MTKEQEVIEYFKKQIESCSENADICDDNNFNEEAAYLRKQRYMYKTVLNMLNKYSAESAEKDKIIAEKSVEIEKLEKESKQYFETTIKQAKQFDKEIENYKNLIADVSIIAQELGLEEDGTTDEIIAQIGRFKNNINILDQECSRLERKEAKQDKMIDLIINTVYKRFKAELVLEYGFENEEQFKQCFERRVEDETI